MRIFLSTLAAAFVAAALQTAASAHYIWATVENNRARFALLESVSEAPDARFEKYVANLTPTAGGKALTLGTATNGARFAPLPAGQSVVLADSVIGAKERDGARYLLIYHAKGAASLAAAGTDTKAPVEILARRDGQDLVVAVHQNDRPAARSEVWVQWPGEEDPTSIKTDAHGEVRIAWPEAAKGGIVGIRALVSEAKSGEDAGKKYASIHHWATLTFPIAAMDK